MKLQLWDTAGTERFRSVSRSYYRGAAGALLIYDVSSLPSFKALPTFLNDARALASPDLTLILVGNKVDLASNYPSHGSVLNDVSSSPDSTPSRRSTFGNKSSTGGTRLDSHRPSISYDLGSHLTATVAPEGREVASEEASRWASRSAIPVSVEVSAYTGEGVEDVFTRLAAIILTKIELGEIDPSDPMSGIQYGDGGCWDDGGSIRTVGTPRRKDGAWANGMREWEAVFRLDGSGRRRRGGCC